MTLGSYIEKKELEYLKYALDTYGTNVIAEAIYMEQEELTPAQVGIVLGGPDTVLEARLDKALKLWNNKSITELLVLSGNHGLFDIRGYLGQKDSEAEKMRQMIFNKGIEYTLLKRADKLGINRNIDKHQLYILEEYSSTSTDRNAKNTAEELLDIYGGTLPSTTVITSESHIKRAAMIFRKYFRKEILQFCAAHDGIGDKDVFLNNPYQNYEIARELLLRQLFNKLYGEKTPIEEAKKLILRNQSFK